MKLGFPLSLLLLLSTSSALANEERALPCRPTIACTADLVPAGDLEIESGVASKRTRTGFALTTPLLAKYSVSHALQVQLGGNMLSAVRTDVRSTYLDNMIGALKLHVVDQSARMPAIALSAGFGVPTFRALGYTRAYDAFFTGYVTKDVGPIHLDLNVGANALALDADVAMQGMIALAASAALTQHFGIMLESYGFSDAGTRTPRDAGLLFAFTHSPEPWLIFDVGGDASYFPSTRTVTAFVGATFVPLVVR